MKRSLPVLVILLALWQQAAATNVSGAIINSVTWTKANSPYVVTANLLVGDGVVLTIEPGVEVRVAQDVRIYVDGGIHAIGTSIDTVVFTSDLASPHRNSWYGIHLRDEGIPDSSSFRNCRFSWSEGAIRSFTPVNITRCTFINCKFGVSIGNSSYNSIADSNIVTHCDGGMSTGAPGSISANVMWDIMDGISASGAPVVRVSDNYVDASSNGIWYSMSTLSGPAQLHNNVVVNAKLGFWISGHIKGPGIYGNISAYTDLGFRLDGVNGNVQYNTGLHNKIGVEIMYGGWTGFRNNCIDSCTDYFVVVKNWDDVDVSGNYWGTTDTATLNAKMFDFWDDFVSPKGTILPALAQPDVSCKPYTGPIVTKVPDTKTNSAIITLSPNPFTNSFTINLQGKASKLAVFNMAGQQVYNADVKGRDKMEVDMSAYPAGVYHYRVTLTDNTIAAGKLVKQ
ncbi:MAG: hypothetical protein K0R82_2255 [Flavipsychrobacter sp.]|nr:hypothetical protein [Flavipsychrobacter sp.]